MLNRHGSSELKKLGIPFLFPKPTSLLKKILKITNTADNDIILDFFAGSGTTAHAVMELNKEDGGNRKYILVQLPELTEENSEAHKAGFKTISDITIERVKRVSEKIQKEDEEKLLKEGRNLDLGFKVFKLAPSFFPENQFTPDPEKTEEENIKALDEYLEKTKSQMKFEFDEEELLFEILLKDGFKLNYTKKLIGEINKNKVYKVMDGEKEALICLDDSIENSTLKILEGMKDMRFICLERAVDTTKKWNLKSIFGQNLWVA
jgi:adenine-specific DNA-methyltransferase